MSTLFSDLFILAYLLVGLLWHLSSVGRWSRVLHPLGSLVRWLGFEQHWGMFAPDPPTSDCELAVMLELDSGGALLWEPPRLHSLSRWDAFLGFRYRSYEHDILYDEESPAGRAALAEYLLRKYEFGSDRPPAVALVYFDRPLPAPGLAHPGAPATRGVFYRYRRSQEER
jgi:hypothetical protein